MNVKMPSLKQVIVFGVLAMGFYESWTISRRKMQRELRDAVTRNEELETQNKHLEKRLDKLKTAKSNLLKEL